MSTTVVPAPATEASRPDSSEKLADKTEQKQAARNAPRPAQEVPAVEAVSEEMADAKAEAAGEKEAPVADTAMASNFEFAGALAEAADAAAGLTVEAREAGDTVYAQYGDEEGGNGSGTILLVAGVALAGLGVAALASGGDDDDAVVPTLPTDPTNPTDPTDPTDPSEPTEVPIDNADQFLIDLFDLDGPVPDGSIIVLDPNDAFVLIDAVGARTDLVVRNFNDDDVIQVTGAGLSSFTFGTSAGDPNDLQIVLSEGGNFTNLILDDALVGFDGFIFEYDDAVAALGFDFMTFA